MQAGSTVKVKTSNNMEKRGGNAHRLMDFSHSPPCNHQDRWNIICMFRVEKGLTRRAEPLYCTYLLLIDRTCSFVVVVVVGFALGKKVVEKKKHNTKFMVISWPF